MKSAPLGVLLPILFLLLFGGAFQAAYGQGDEVITIDTDKKGILPYESLVISGMVLDVLPGDKPMLSVFDPNGDLITDEHVDVDGEGNYAHEWKAEGLAKFVGVYRFVISYGQLEAETSVLISDTLPSTCERPSVDIVVAFRYYLQQGNTTYPIRYVPINSTLTSMQTDFGRHSLIAQVFSTDEGCIFFLLPSEVIEAENRNFTVTVNDQPGTFREIENSVAETRTLNISLDEGTNTIVMTGTRVVPEFALASPIMLGIGAVGIAITASWMAKRRFLNKP